MSLPERALGGLQSLRNLVPIGQERDQQRCLVGCGEVRITELCLKTTTTISPPNFI